MPQIIVTADEHGSSNGAVMFTERVTARDFESGHFKRQLAERLEWAVGDAQAVEQQVEAVEQQFERVGPYPPRRSARVVTTASYTPAP